MHGGETAIKQHGMEPEKRDATKEGCKPGESRAANGKRSALPRGERAGNRAICEPRQEGEWKQANSASPSLWNARPQNKSERGNDPCGSEDNQNRAVDRRQWMEAMICRSTRGAEKARGKGKDIEGRKASAFEDRFRPCLIGEASRGNAFCYACLPSRVRPASSRNGLGFTGFRRATDSGRWEDFRPAAS